MRCNSSTVSLRLKSDPYIRSVFLRLTYCFSSRMRKHFLNALPLVAAIASSNSMEAIPHANNLHRQDTVVTTLSGVEVKATRASKKVSSATPFHKIDASKIKLTGISDISDAMRRMPGVNLRDYGGAGGLKTVSVRGLGSEHTAIIYDGVALSDCQSGQIDLSRYSTDNVSSLALYSSDADDIFIPARASASASSLYINSFTAPDIYEDSLYLKAQIRVGSFGYYNPYARVANGNGRGLSFSAAAQYLHSDNNYPFTLHNGSLVTREERENSKMDAWTGELNGRWHICPGSTLIAKLYYYDNSRDLPGQVIYYVTGSNEHLRERNFFGQMQLRSRLSSKISLLATGKFNWATSRYTDVNGKYPGGQLDNYYLQRETYFSGALLYVPRRELIFDYSADWAWNNLTSNLATAIRPYRNSILQSLAAKYNAGCLTVLARALYSIYLNDAKDGDAGNNHSRFSPSVSLSFRPFADLGLYLRSSYKNIFRVPTFNEAYFDNFGSINLEPETTDQFNLGLTYQAPSLTWISELSVTYDGYINHVDNKIVAIPYNMFLWTMTNLGKVRVLGADITLSATFNLAQAQSLLLTGSYSYQRAQPRTSRDSYEWMKQVAYIPLNSGSVSLTWMNPWVNTVAHLAGCSSRYTTNTNLPETRIGGYADTGVSLFKTFPLRNGNSFEIRAELLNIFNTQYEIVARYPMPGRSWRVAVEFDI